MTNPFPAFAPLLTGFSFVDLASVVLVSLAILVVSSAASATYIVNDLLNLNNDRGHARKRDRPFASCVMAWILV